MKNQEIALIFHITFIALLVAGVVNPGCMAAYVAGAYLWVMMVITWTAIALGSLSYIGSGAFRKNIHAKIRPLIIGDAAGRSFRKWGMRLLIVISASLSGFYGLIFVYVVTLIVCRVLATTYDQEKVSET
ncbi:DNZ54_00345 family protein [Erwinia aphidicola]|uniref:DNZ54_00345 family protein n=1 Tax=Erwinia aphidicola TaxID=68334 RepID=UPI003CF3620B